MTTYFYDWEDATDPYATGVPDLRRHPDFRLNSKAAVRKELRDYRASVRGERSRPRFRVWRVSYEEVTI
jgi:hypothetical protein